MTWRDRRRAEELGYTERCVGCGAIGDTAWCGCDAGAPEPNDMDDEEEEDA